MSIFTEVPAPSNQNRGSKRVNWSQLRQTKNEVRRGFSIFQLQIRGPKGVIQIPTPSQREWLLQAGLNVNPPYPYLRRSEGESPHPDPLNQMRFEGDSPYTNSQEAERGNPYPNSITNACVNDDCKQVLTMIHINNCILVHDDNYHDNNHHHHHLYSQNSQPHLRMYR